MTIQTADLLDANEDRIHAGALHVVAPMFENQRGQGRLFAQPD